MFVTDGGKTNSDAMIIQSDSLEVENEFKREASMTIVYQNRRRRFGIKMEGEMARETEQRVKHVKDKNFTSSTNFTNEFEVGSSKCKVTKFGTISRPKDKELYGCTA